MMTAAYNTLGDAERIAALSRGTLVRGAKRKMLVADKVLTPVELELQAATLARDYDAMFTKNGVPFSWPIQAPLGKYSFVDRPDGRYYVPFSQAEIERFAYSPYAKIKPKYKCPDKRRRQIIRRFSAKSAKTARKFPATDPRSIRHLFPGRTFCKPASENPLKKIAIGAAVVTAGIFLGPAILSGVGTAAKGAIGVGGKLLGVAAKAAPFAEKIVNSKAMVDAIKAGEMPGPPISLGDGSLTDYAQVVGQQMLERDLARAATAGELAQLNAMIDQQRQLMAQQERPHFPVVNSGLDPALTAAQKERADQAVGENNLMKALAIALPVGLVFLTRS